MHIGFTQLGQDTPDGFVCHQLTPEDRVMHSFSSILQKQNFGSCESAQRYARSFFQRDAKFDSPESNLHLKIHEIVRSTGGA